MARTEHDVIKKLFIRQATCAAYTVLLLKDTNSVGTFIVFATFCHVCNRVLQENEQEH